MTNLRHQARRMYSNVEGVIRRPPLAPPGHYYSPLTTAGDGERALRWVDEGVGLSDVNIDLNEMKLLADELAPMWPDLQQDQRYRRDLMFEISDAAVYHSMLRHFRPSRVIEVGSGYSTAVALDTIETHGLKTSMTCIEPNPERLQTLIRRNDHVELLTKLVQDVPLTSFDDLGDRDFLFLDSTHVVKAGSDVVWTTLRVLPRLKKGVLVHIHDMFWPFEYQEKWLRQRRDWNEIYLIHAYLSGNPNWRVRFFSDHIWQTRPGLVDEYLPSGSGARPGSLWLEKIS